MNAWTDKLASLAPPLWLVAAVAAVMAAGLLTAFVNTVHDHLRHEQLVARMPAKPMVMADSGALRLR